MDYYDKNVGKVYGYAYEGAVKSHYHRALTNLQKKMR